MISIIIPAHNEARVIARCLQALTCCAEPGEFEIIVVCNGCMDNTASVARRHQPEVTVLETEMPSKTNALNIGDAAATGWPRFYVDADIVMDTGAVRGVASVLRESPGVFAAAPLMCFDFTDRRWTIRAFYEVWSALPYCRVGMIGSGVYALSRELRGRFDQFPQITADDAFVRLHCKPEERFTVASHRFTVFPPRTIGALIRISTRAYFGDYELRAKSPELFLNKQDGHGHALLGLLKNPIWWARIVVYLYVRVLSRLLAYRRFYFGDHRHWERDETSRQPLAVNVENI
jgi:glycosyltransferase involved in cell wall biosynthesis